MQGKPSEYWNLFVSFLEQTLYLANLQKYAYIAPCLSTKKGNSGCIAYAIPCFPVLCRCSLVKLVCEDA